MSNQPINPEDPRVRFAAERTLGLAAHRLGLMGFGFVVARFGLFLARSPPAGTFLLINTPPARRCGSCGAHYPGSDRHFFAAVLRTSISASFKRPNKGQSYIPRTAMLAADLWPHPEGCWES